MRRAGWVGRLVLSRRLRLTKSNDVQGPSSVGYSLKWVRNIGFVADRNYHAHRLFLPTTSSWARNYPLHNQHAPSISCIASPLLASPYQTPAKTTPSLFAFHQSYQLPPSVIPSKRISMKWCTAPQELCIDPALGNELGF